MIRNVLLGASLLLACQAHAATVFKCVDAKGKAYFTQQNCPDNHALADVVSPRSQEPSGSSAPTRMAVPVRRYQLQGAESQYISPERQKGGAKVTVVGGSADLPPCQTGLSDRDLRTAKVRGQIVTGMSRDDVESMYGAVNKDTPPRGAGASTYWRDKYVQQTSVAYDRNGCVRGTYQSGFKP